LKTNTITAVLLIILMSCESKSNKNSDFIGSYKIEQYADSILLTSSILKIDSNNKYEYDGKDLEINKTLFSTGKWKLKNDTLILKTDKNINCFFVNNSISFQCDNFEEKKSKDVIKQYFEPNLTVKNCIPKDSSQFYTNLDDEKFFLTKGKLNYKKRKNDCSKYLNHIKFIITKMK
jgi:hypothetical protein